MSVVGTSGSSALSLHDLKPFASNSRKITVEDMADAPVGTQSAGLRSHGAHDLVGMQATLHQDLALAFMDQLDAARRRSGLRLRGVDDLVTGDVQAVLRGDVLDPSGGADKDRLDDTCLRRLDSASQRTLVAGMDNDGR